jgi:glycosyltransferase involved in cell wall biosynthesis
MAGTGGVVLVEQFFYPDGWGGAQIPRDVAAAIRAAGIDVSVLCGTEQYVPVRAELAGPDPAASGIRIVRIAPLLPGSPRTLRAVRAIWFCACALAVLCVRRGVRMLLTQTNPPLVIPAMALAAALRGIPLVIIAQDLYPEVLFASQLLAPSSWAGRALKRLYAWAYRRARKVIVLGPCMAERVRRKGVAAERIVTISNWATGELAVVDRSADNPLRERWNLHGHFIALYSGNLGSGHEFETLLEGVRRAAARIPELVLVIIGRGSRHAEVRAQARALGLQERVRFFDFVSAEELRFSIALADIAVVTLRTGFEGVVVPSKLFGYLARGVPTLYIGPESDVAHIVRTGDCGAVCAPGDAARVAQVLEAAAADPAMRAHWAANARALYQRQFKRELALEAYVALTKDLAGCSSR